MVALLLPCGDGPSYATKEGAALLRTEGTGDFLFDLDHTKIAFCQVIIEGHPEVLHEAQGVLLVSVESIE